MDPIAKARHLFIVSGIALLSLLTAFGTEQFVTAAVTETADAYAVRIEVQGKGIPPVLWHQRNWPDLATCEKFLGSAEFQIEFLKLAMAIIETDDDADLLAPPSCQLIGRPS